MRRDDEFVRQLRADTLTSSRSVAAPATSSPVEGLLVAVNDATFSGPVGQPSGRRHAAPAPEPEAADLTLFVGQVPRTGPAGWRAS